MYVFLINFPILQTPKIFAVLRATAIDQRFYSTLFNFPYVENTIMKKSSYFQRHLGYLVGSQSVDDKWWMVKIRGAEIRSISTFRSVQSSKRSGVFWFSSSSLRVRSVRSFLTVCAANVLGNWIIKWQKVISLAFKRYAFPETFGNKFPKKWLEQFFICNSISPLKLVDSSRRTVCFIVRVYLLVSQTVRYALVTTQALDSCNKITDLLFQMVRGIIKFFNWKYSSP